MYGGVRAYLYIGTYPIHQYTNINQNIHQYTPIDTPMNLHKYQQKISDQAAEKLKRFGLVYLSMEVRTGKTITALEAARKYGARKILFVTKKKAIKSILKDAEHFPLLEVTAVNYEGLHKVTGTFDLVVADEAHCLGAFPKPSKRTVRLKKLAEGLPIIYLSGTPSPESYSQLYHQLYISSFSPFRDYRNFYKWAAEFVIKKTKFVFNRQINDYSEARKELIDQEAKHLFISYTQEQAGFDVAVQEKVLFVPMLKVMPMIKSLHLYKVLTIGNNYVLADTTVKEMTKIQQLCGGTVLSETGEAIILEYSKAYFIRDYFKGKKIAVYYKFKAEFELLTKVFTNYTTSPESFQKSTENVFLGQFQSSREGIRLDTADAIVFYGIDFSYLSYEQAKNRIISKERTKEAVLYWVFAEGGIEEKIYKVVKNKQSYTTSYFTRDYGKIRSYHSERNYTLPGELRLVCS